ncbi:MAG TPA: Asp-tRNA(Asn)/Glu-tRNA(Gln) amidotransferase subunit GatC [Gemmatimonadaceae bacterium]|nr:Asp-tRNA(Asn)/Glu-tRNA(Gln) amidotransferase subunit GatC [Gemmatimonadaceae bacterium]
MAVTQEDVEHIANLARLALDERRIPELVQQLNAILEHMDVLQQVDTRKVIGASGVGDQALPLREDKGVPLPLHRARELFAPEVRDGFFLVPRLATHETVAEEGG